MTIIEVLRSSRRGYPTPVWQRWNGVQPGDAGIQEQRAIILRAVWPQWRFRVVLLLEEGTP